jgi:hypothetical protein
MEWTIKFHPLSARSPQLNGKVERTQCSDLEGFWATVDPKAADIEDRLADWQHSGIGTGCTWRWAKYANRSRLRTARRDALADEFDVRYDPQREKLWVADYKVDLALVQLK